eukprot:TRINITY_DN3225_c5_g1_i1.p1 TRINITY_DN3225_c5_g1~~TRINITY_DN3225_c5_g1_i1.p1  ORF type:complete len:1698 (-),score=443.16 TRINITY_DN3225_c5_g1_i1:254-4717(-)
MSISGLIFNSYPPAPVGSDLTKKGEVRERDSLILEKREGRLDNYGPLPSSDIPAESPEVSANIFSQLTYWWLNPLLAKGYYTALVHDDLPPLLTVDDPHDIDTQFQVEWEKELHRDEPSLLASLGRQFGFRFTLGGIVKLGNDASIFAGPIFLQLIVAFINDPTQPIWHGLLYVLAMFTFSMTQSLFINKYFHMIYRVNMNIKAALISAVYEKSMRLSHASRQTSTVGEIVNLQSIDAFRIGQTVTYLHNLWSAPLQIIVSTILLYRVLGYSAFAGIGTMVILLPAQLFLAKKLGGVQKVMMKKKDSRQKTINEVLQGIRVIKFFAWETSFMQKVGVIRDSELATLLKSWLLRTSVTFFWSFTPLLVSVVSFTFFVAVADQTLTAEVAFTALALFNVIRFPLNMLPMIITSVVEARVSLKRLLEFLKLSELDSDAVIEDKVMDSAISVSGGTFTWGDGNAVLSDINIEIAEGSLVAIVGEVGSGKSSLLNAILGEIPKQSGSVKARGRFAYVPQQAWIQNATVRENITFGKSHDDAEYDRTVKVCELTSDFAMLPASDRTEIGEKGINLSGGQKQRVSMARAVYADADVYLLDDPLSAVDAHVGKAIFNNCIHNHLKGKTRVLVTHQLQYMKDCDQIIVLKKGKVTEIGTFKDLMKSGATFAKLIKKHVSATKDDKKKNSKKGDDAADDKKDDAAQEAGTGKKDSKLMGKEGRAVGGVKGKVYASYLGAIGGWFIGFLLVFFYVAQTAASMLSNYWLSYWSTISSEQEDLREYNLKYNITNNDTMFTTFTTFNLFGEVSLDSHIPRPLPTPRSFLPPLGTSSSLSPSPSPPLPSLGGLGRSFFSVFASPSPSTAPSSLPPAPEVNTLFYDWGLGVYFYLLIYGLLGVAQALFILFSQLALVKAGLNSARVLHEAMLKRILRAPVSFFDTTPVGRILNRFGKDQYSVDESLPQTVGSAFRTSLSVLSVVIIIGTVTPAFLLAVIPLAYIYRFVQKYYLNSSREIQRLDSISKSPIFAMFSETIGGLSTIRAYQKKDEFIKANNDLVELNQRAYYMWAISNRWLAFRLEFVGAIVILAAAFFSVVQRSTIAAGLAGLSLTYALQLTGSLNWLVRMSTEVENNLVAVERLDEYGAIEVEAPPRMQPPPPSSWPASGCITFDQVEMRYRPGLPLVLKKVSLDIKSCEKVGVVGRTGAGKSTLMLALFRIVEPSAGKVIIDGIDIGTMGLDDLRERLAIIPQDPTLFTGTIRSNLDPFEKYSDAELWRSLEAVSLQEQVKDMEGSLDSEVAEFGENLSVGTRQLMCLARALLRQSNILVMDEATASVDFETDSLIQETIKTAFKDVTVLTIAHRINTIMDSDRVIVMDKGEVIEFDSPANLLKKKTSLFYSLANQGGAIKDKSSKKGKKRSSKKTKKPSSKSSKTKTPSSTAKASSSKAKSTSSSPASKAPSSPMKSETPTIVAVPTDSTSSSASASASSSSSSSSSFNTSS